VNKQTAIQTIFFGSLLVAQASLRAFSAEPVRPIKKIAIVALARDTARAAEVEAALKTNFVQHGVAADSLRSLVGRDASAAEILDRLGAKDYDTLLCIAPRKTIRMAPPEAGSKIATLESCLKTFASGTLPTGQPLDYNLLAADPRKPPALTQGSDLRGPPIPTNPHGGPIQVSKGELRLFDIASSKLLWEGLVGVKMPAELQEDLQTKFIAREVWSVIENGKILPKK
jgi:hypothetical protein